MKKNLSFLEKKLGFSLEGGIKLIRQAFIHRSFVNESQQESASNERLEFLGDVVLSLIVSTYIYQKFPDQPEGDLTNFRASLVKTSSLAEAAKKLDLSDYLVLSRGENNSGGRNNPSILADTFEALLGAIYLEFGLEKAIYVIEKNLLPNLDVIIKEHRDRDYKSLFQEVIQGKSKHSPIYEVITTIGPDHAKTFTIGVYVDHLLIAKGSGKSKQAAEQEAARLALEKYGPK
jgi:ribonuclease-3